MAKATRRIRRKAWRSAEGRPHPKTYGDPDELVALLIHDAAHSVPTDLQWAALAYDRIARLRYPSAGNAMIGAAMDAAFNEVQAATRETTGRELPL